MRQKHWIESAEKCLEECLVPVPHEVNELDWKVRLSENKERLVEHLIASANHPDGACLVFGVADDGQPQGIDTEAVAQISNTLANLGRDVVEPCLALDHSVIQFRGVPLLLVRVPEHSNKPVHRRGKSVEEAWIRSGGTTRKASRHEVGVLMLNSVAPSWESLRASPLMSLDDVRATLDLDSVAALLQTPLPTDPQLIKQWLLGEGLAAADGRGYYVTNLGAIAAARKLSEFDTLKRIVGAGPMIGVFDDRIEVTNPGTLLPGKRLDRLIGTTPESRNERLAWSFRRYRICEERGTGFQKVVSATEAHCLP